MSIAVIAGEASGDIIGSEILSRFRQIDSVSNVYIVGGPEMQSVEDCATLFDASELSVVGITEVASRYFELRSRLNRLVATLLELEIELLVTVDFPGFNLRLARKLSRAGVRTVHIVSPQVWAWREGRVKMIRRYVDELVVLFPFEVDWYKDRDIDVQYFGHPLLDQIIERRSRVEQEAAMLFGDEPRPIICWMAGSRNGEVRRHFPMMVAAAEQLGSIRFRHIFSRVEGVDPALYVSPDSVQIEFYDGPTDILLQAASLGVIKSGTTTLQALMYRLPMIVVYKVSRLTYAIASRLAKVKHIAMPNVLAGHQIVPELIQNDFSLTGLTRQVEKMSADNERTRVSASYSKILGKMQRGGAAERTACFLSDQIVVVRTQKQEGGVSKD